MRVFQLRPWKLLNAVMLSIGLIAVAVYFVFDWLDDSEPRVQVRVNQYGYSVNDVKQAVIYANEEHSDAQYAVKNEAGQILTSGKLGENLGEWSYSYQAVYMIDFSDVSEVGTYTVSVSDGATGKSPTFRIETSETLTESYARSFASGYLRTQRDTEHVSDAEASVYLPPKLDKEGHLSSALSVTDVVRDVSGGWYDGHGYAKFTYSSAYTVAGLAHVLLNNPGNHAELREEMLYGAQWLQKMWDAEKKVLYAQVGLVHGNSDVQGEAGEWRLPSADASRTVEVGYPEYYLTHRPVFAAHAEGEAVPASLAGRVAAALALTASAVGGDEGRAYFDAASALYEAADRSAEQSVVTAYPSQLYPKKTWRDEMALAAGALARAGQTYEASRAALWSSEAQQWLTQHADDTDVRVEEAPADVTAFAAAYLSKEGQRESGVGLIDASLTSLERKARENNTPLLVSLDEQRATQRLSSVAFAERVYRRSAERQGDEKGALTHRAAATFQRDAVFGANPWGVSFVLDVGDTTPKCPRHMIANLQNDTSLLRAGVVGGPSSATGSKSGFKPRGAKECSGVLVHQFDANAAKYIDSVAAVETNTPTLSASTIVLLSLAG